MTRPIVYIAGPIDQSIDSASDRAYAAGLLAKEGFTVYSPGQAWAGVEGQATVQEVNGEALRMADGVLAMLPDGVATIGTPMEIEHALTLGKAVVVVGGLAARKSPVLAEAGVPIFGEMEQAVAMLGDMLLVSVTVEAWGESSESRETEADIMAAMPAKLTRATWDFLLAVAQEIERAGELHPLNPRTTARKWFSVTAEEMVELCQAWNDNVDTDAVVRDAEPIKTESVQVAAMCARLWRAL